MEYDPLLTMSALNMAIVSLHRITSSGDRLILDREYTNIINNIRMGEINADPELTSLYQEIVRVIHSGRIRDEIRAELSAKYSERQKKTLGEIISGNLLKSFKSNPLQWLRKIASSSASEYFESLKEERRQEQRKHYDSLKLKHDELSEYDGLQRRLLGASWNLMRKYNLPDNYRLTQDGLENFIAALNETDPRKRNRMLKYIESEFSAYAPYWFHRAKSTSESGNDDEAGKYFAKFAEVWRPVLRKDPCMAESMKYKIASLIRGGNNAGEILKCLDVMRENSRLDEWANNIYMAMIYFALGENGKAEELVMCNIDFEYETQNSRKLLVLFQGKTLPEESSVLDEKPSIWKTFLGWMKPEPVPEVKAVPSSPKNESHGKIALTLADATPIQPELPKPETIPDVNAILSSPKTESHDKSAPTVADETRKRAENGDAAAQFQLGRMYYLGDGVEEDYDEAFKWYSKSAEQNYAEAQIKLGFMYRIGYGVSKNESESEKWLSKAAELYRKGAENGDSEAQFQLGFLYRVGWGVTEDKSEAIKWHRKAAEQGHITAQIKLGDMYASGEGVEQNYHEAFIWYHKAAVQGNAWAQNKVGDMYYHGEGTEQNYHEAFIWYHKAAVQGNADAQFNLGAMYSRGYAVEQDKAEALKWWTKAAEQGIVLAQVNLGVMYASSRHRDIPQNYSEAAKWFRMAAEKGDTYAQDRLKRLGETL